MSSPGCQALCAGQSACTDCGDGRSVDSLPGTVSVDGPAADTIQAGSFAADAHGWTRPDAGRKKFNCRLPAPTFQKKAHRSSTFISRS
jgi:hypothetical protein